MWKKIDFKKFVLDILFPKICLSCHKEGSYLCEDCLATIEISQYQYCLCEKPKRVIEGGKCQRCRFRKLNGLYSATSYQNNLTQELIHKFKYEPFIKELANPLSLLIISHFQLLNNPPTFFDFCLIPIPLEKKREKWRGFNQAKELSRGLSKCLDIPLFSDALLKIKGTLPQVVLTGKERKENIKNVFLCQNQEKLQGRKIILIDDIYTTGATLEEAARALKAAGAREVWGVVIARG